MPSFLANTVHRGESRYARDEVLVWRDPDRLPVRTCGYCGGIHPEDFATLKVAQSGRVERADMKYGWPHKYYVDIENPEPNKLEVIGSSYPAAYGPYAPGGEKYQPPGDQYVAWEDMTPEQAKLAEKHFRPDHGRLPSHVLFGTHRSLHGKFYTIHLLEPGLDEQTKQACFARMGLIIEPGKNPGSVQWRPFPYGGQNARLV